ncbi:GNAT family N-acetyltransferase [Ornithinimicrobium sp. Arc0846-15]|nr:GNAT family N-acetyltransferase [Ornithinimicrobium laminariae]
MWTSDGKPPQLIEFALPGNAQPHRLERSTLEDVAGVAGAVQSSLPELESFMDWVQGGYAEADALVFLQLSEDWWESDQEYNWSIRTPDGAIVGMCGLMRRQGEGSLEIGYWLRTDVTGQGIATAVTKSLVEVALMEPSVRSVFLLHADSNPGSGRVAEKAGFSQIGQQTRPAIDQNGPTQVWAIGDLEFRPAELGEVANTNSQTSSGNGRARTG